MRNKIIIVGITSDIGKELASNFYQDGYDVVGTYNSEKNLKFLPVNKYKLLKINMLKINNRDILQFKKVTKNWKIFISCTGTLNPIGKFFENKIKKIKDNFNINFFSNIELLSSIVCSRKKSSHIFFFSGSGSNGPSNDLSSYCLSKLMLIKSAELISEEYKGINCTTIGPGFINTKIHKELIISKERAKKAYKKYLNLKNMETDNNEHAKLYSLIKTCIKNPQISNGRNFSSKYDDWKNNFFKLKTKIKKDKNFFKLRRYDAN